MTSAPPWLAPAAFVAAACAPAWAHAQAPALSAAESELLSGARMWAGKNRTDMARQLVEKMLALRPDAPQALALLGELALREKKPDEARRMLARLREIPAGSAAARELEILLRVHGPDAEKLAQMRLMARAGRKAEAADLARELFPEGAPTLGGLALEYHLIIGTATRQGRASLRELDRLYAQTGEPRYRLAQLEVRLAQGESAAVIAREIETIAERPDVNQQQLQEQWRRTLERLPNAAAHEGRLRAFLQRFPGDTAATERLAALQQAAERAARAARDPANIARNAARTALEQGDAAAAEEQLQQVLALRPHDGESLGNLGLIRLRQGAHAEAADLFAKAHAHTRQARWKDLLQTARFWGLLRQADRALDAGELSLAADLAQRALALQADNAEALATLAGIRDAQQDQGAAEHLYQQALTRDAAHTGAIRGLAALYGRTGRAAQALALLGDAAARDPALAGRLAPVHAALLVSQADAHLQAQRTGAAMRALEAALVVAPADAWARHRLARLYLRLGLRPEALQVMDQGVARAATEPAPDMLYARALIRAAVDDYDGALADLAGIPQDRQTASMRELGQRATVRSLVAQAVSPRTVAAAGQTQRLLAQAEQAAGNHVDLLSPVANAWFALGRPQQGIAVFGRLEARSAPVPANAQLEHAQLLHRAQADAAVADRLPALLLERIWNSEQESRLVALYAAHRVRLIEGQRQAGNTRAASQLAREPLPEPVAAAAQRAQLQARLLTAAGEYGDAAALLRPLLAAEPHRTDIRMALAEALSRVGDGVGADAHAQQLERELPPDDVAPRLALVRIWQRIGRVEQARALTAQLRETFPGDSDVLLHAARLERGHRNYQQALVFFRSALMLERRAEATTPAAAADMAPAPPDGPGHEADAPMTLRQSYTLSGAPQNAAIDSIQSEIDAIEARRQPRIEFGHQALHKRSTEGTSSLRGWERPMVAWFPRGYDGHHFLHVDHIELDAGDLPAGGSEFPGFGLAAALPPGAPQPYRRQRGSGVNVGFGYAGDDVQWDIGATGVGLPVTNVVGGIARMGEMGRYRYRLEVFRRPVTGSLLSYAGARDAVTGDIWGGVVATGVAGRVSTDMGPYNASVSANAAALTGRHVANNTRLQIRLAADRDLWRTSRSSLNAAMALSLWHYGKDLSNYTFGHGGYYSPRTYAALAAPLEWTGRQGALTWLVRAAVSVSRSSSGASDLFPNHPALQAQARARLASTGASAVFAGSSGSGFGRSLRAALEYQLTPQWALGAQLDLDRSAYYAPTSISFYGRYRFDGTPAPLDARPRPVQPYSSF